MWLFLMFLTIPLIEIALFIQVGGSIGLWPTLGIVVLTAVVGTWLVRSQGVLALARLRTSFSKLDDPTEPLAHGAMILFAGALLLTPGFFTDAVGLTLLMPPVRHRVFIWAKQRIKVQTFEMGPDSGAKQSQPQSYEDNPSHPTIEAEYHEVDPNKKPTHGPSGWTKH